MKEVAAQEWKWLVGGKIAKVVEITDPDDEWSEGPTLAILVEFAKPKTFTLYGEKIEGVMAAKLEVWRDEEGNGPGELVLAETLALAPEESATVRSA